MKDVAAAGNLGHSQFLSGTQAAAEVSNGGVRREAPVLHVNLPVPDGDKWRTERRRHTLQLSLAVAMPNKGLL